MQYNAMQCDTIDECYRRLNVMMVVVMMMMMMVIKIMIVIIMTMMIDAANFSSVSFFRFLGY